MLVLVPKPLKSLGDMAHHPNLGQLVQPRSWWTPDGSVPWAADNDAFNSFDPPRFVAMLDRLAGIPGCMWVAAPDSVADASATLALFDEWQPAIRVRGFPVALVLQDGISPNAVPWGRVDAVFVGGSTVWKMSPQAHALVIEAGQRGKSRHMGRVNTRRRIKLAKSWECDSVDGTASARFTNSTLPWMLEHASSNTQLSLDTNNRLDTK